MYFHSRHEASSSKRNRPDGLVERAMGCAKYSWRIPKSCIQISSLMARGWRSTIDSRPRPHIAAWERVADNSQPRVNKQAVASAYHLRQR